MHLILVRIDMRVEDDVVSLMTFHCFRVLDRPRLVIFVTGKGLTTCLFAPVLARRTGSTRSFDSYLPLMEA